MKRKLTITLAAAAALAVTAQQLNKEIIIEREITPTLRAVTRLNNRPTLYQPQVAESTLTFSDMTTSAEVPSTLTPLEPAASNPALPRSPYRGYLQAGYFPTFNLGVSAGYEVLNTPRTSLGIWGQYDGNSYKDRADERLTRNAASVGLDLAQVVGRAGRLDVNIDYTYGHLNRPWERIDSTYSIHRVNARAKWSARRAEMLYFVAASYGLTGLSNVDHPDAVMGVNYVSPSVERDLKQSVADIKGGVSYFLTDKSAVAVAASIDLVHYNHYNQFTVVDDKWLTPQLAAGNAKTLGLITLTPTYRYHAGAFAATVGARVQISTKADKTFHIAPEARLTLKPVSYVTADLRLTGGEHINDLGHLYDINPYSSVSLGYGFSHIPLSGDLSLLVGPFKGAYVKLLAGYTAANDWLMPAAAYYGGVTFAPVNLSAWRYGAEIGYKYNSLFEVNARYSGAPGSYNHADYHNADRAKHLLDASLKVYPIAPLEVEASFALRAGRSMYHDPRTFDPGILGAQHTDPINLKNGNSLNLGARYTLTERFALFARVENILANRSLDINLRERQGLKGLVGLSYKF